MDYRYGTVLVAALGIALAAAMWFGFVPLVLGISHGHVALPADTRALVGLSVAANAVVLAALVIARRVRRQG